MVDARHEDYAVPDNQWPSETALLLMDDDYEISDIVCQCGLILIYEMC